MPGISVRPFVFATTFLTYSTSLLWIWAPLKYLLPVTVAWSFIQTLPWQVVWLTFVLSVGHSHFCRRFWLVHQALKAFAVSTPQEHLLHHSQFRACNFGNFSTLWDRVFGSYCDPSVVDGTKEPLGLNYDQDFLGTLTAGRLKLSKPLRHRLQVDSFCRLYE